MTNLRTQITLSLPDVQLAVHQWLREKPERLPVVDLILNRDQTNLLSAKAVHYFDAAEIALAMQAFVERETGLASLAVKWNLASDKVIESCTVECEMPRPPRDIIPLQLSVASAVAAGTGALRGRELSEALEAIDRSARTTEDQV